MIGYGKKLPWVCRVGRHGCAVWASHSFSFEETLTIFFFQSLRGEGGTGMEDCGVLLTQGKMGRRIEDTLFLLSCTSRCDGEDAHHSTPDNLQCVETGQPGGGGP